MRPRSSCPRPTCRCRRTRSASGSATARRAAPDSRAPTRRSPSHRGRRARSLIRPRRSPLRLRLPTARPAVATCAVCGLAVPQTSQVQTCGSLRRRAAGLVGQASTELPRLRRPDRAWRSGASACRGVTTARVVGRCCAQLGVLGDKHIPADLPAGVRSPAAGAARRAARHRRHRRTRAASSSSRSPSRGWPRTCASSIVEPGLPRAR